jgi:hypothetical protein
LTADHDPAQAGAVGEPRTLDLLGEIRTVLDGLEDDLRGRIVDLEMPRLQVQADAEALRRTLTSLVAEAVRRSPPGCSITVRSFKWAPDGERRAGSAARPVARVEVVVDSAAPPTRAVDDFEFMAVGDDVSAMGGEFGGQSEPGRHPTLWFTVPLPSGASGTPDA